MPAASPVVAAVGFLAPLLQVWWLLYSAEGSACATHVMASVGCVCLTPALKVFISRALKGSFGHHGAVCMAAAPRPALPHPEKSASGTRFQEHRAVFLLVSVSVALARGWAPATDPLSFVPWLYQFSPLTPSSQGRRV